MRSPALADCSTTLLGHEVPATGKKLMLRKRSLMSKRIHKESVALPWLSHPPRNPSLPWVPEDRRPNEWLKLFYGERPLLDM